MSEHQPERPETEPGGRRTQLPDGRVLEVRAAGEADIDGLQRMYDALPFNDRYLRFFTAFKPRHQFFEHMLDVAERGGCVLVAVVHDGGGEDEIAGDAWYSLLPDGDGELAITVAPEWRGWLGPYLLDALLEVAASRGVHNLQAEFLVHNTGMLALARARGYVTVDNNDPGTMRVAIPTHGHEPSWPDRADERVRVLVETPTGRWEPPRSMTDEPLAVRACPGPRRGPGSCPALRGEQCPLARDADMIVMALPADDPNRDALIAAHRSLHTNVPLCIELGEH